MKRTVALLVTGLTIAGCATGSSHAQSTHSQTAPPAHTVPAPFTAAQLRSALVTPAEVNLVHASAHLDKSIGNQGFSGCPAFLKATNGVAAVEHPSAEVDITKHYSHGIASVTEGLSADPSSGFASYPALARDFTACHRLHLKSGALSTNFRITHIHCQGHCVEGFFLAQIHGVTLVGYFLFGELDNRVIVTTDGLVAGNVPKLIGVTRFFSVARRKLRAKLGI